MVCMGVIIAVKVGPLGKVAVACDWVIVDEAGETLKWTELALLEFQDDVSKESWEGRKIIKAG